MNLSEALDAALPEIPKSRLVRTTPPQLDPELIVRDDLLDGEPIVVVYQRSTTNIYRFPPLQWNLVQLFDGVKSYEEIAEEYSAAYAPITADEVKDLASGLDESNFWYRTAQEKNIAMSEKLRAERSRRSHKSVGANLAHISFSAWDPDRYLTRVDNAIGEYLYSGWFTSLVVALFVFEAFVFYAKWPLLSHDIPLYYNFSKKSVADLTSFWLIFFVIGFFHESSHGLTCKHFGGEVHSMGFMFLYLTPCFYVDVSESWVSATRLQRLATIIAGIWIEMVMCGIAMVIWLNTPVGEPIHNFAYQIILITGLAVIVINLNPLIKLDGYYFLTEWIGIPDLKERSTSFLSGWVQNHVFRLPVEVPIVPRRRVLLFACYAILSGLYSYLLLFAVVRFAFNVLTHFVAEWAILPAALLTFVIFRSRIRIFGAFLANFYTARKESALWKVTPLRLAAFAVIAALLFVPIWHTREYGYYLVEPSDVQVLRAGVPGTVRGVYVKEGQFVRKGEPLADLDSLTYDIRSSAAQANLALANAQLENSEVYHQALGSAIAAHGEATRMHTMAAGESRFLTIRAPFDSRVMTASPETLVGKNVGQGENLITVASTGPPKIRIYVPAPALDRVHAGDLVAIDTHSTFLPVWVRLAPLSGETFKLPEGVLPPQQYVGIELPAFYQSRVQLDGPANALRPGMVGMATILDKRRSIAKRIYDGLRNLVRSYVW
ncbi:MAG TPA: HlyD family efflux transporter periplasmic adaptor subunit [Acidobacteriaceae bacterium]|nr:HlyD family efflux transporter periplasmic adaptor subunit [Acidobacteriaceae bacterium]